MITDKQIQLLIDAVDDKEEWFVTHLKYIQYKDEMKELREAMEQVKNDRAQLTEWKRLHGGGCGKTRIGNPTYYGVLKDEYR